MADNVAVTAGAGTSIATDDVGGVHYQVVKLASGAADAATMVSDAAPLPVDDAGGSLTVDNATLEALSKAEDAAHSSGDTGIQSLTVRKDAPAATAGADGDYQPATTDATGRMYVSPPGIGSAGPTMTTLSLGSTATALPTSALANRRAVVVSHAGTSGNLWIGKSTVSAGNGLKIVPGLDPQTFPVNGGAIYASGEPWILQDRQLGTETYVFSLAFLGSGVVLASTGTTGEVYKSTDSGATWALTQRLGTETQVRSLASLGSGVVLAGTYPTGEVYKSTDSGATWALTQRLGTETYVHSLASLGSGVVLAGAGPTGQVYKSTDSGSLPVTVMEY